jgi:hypothetical protein
MKTYRILGILWLVVNCVATVTVIRTLMMPPPNFTQVMYYGSLGSFLVLDLAGILASISLIRGAKWARWFLGLNAICLVFGFVGQVVELKSFSLFTTAYGFLHLSRQFSY